MRTTLNVDDDVLDAAKSLADIRQISIGQALSELARKGLNTRLRMKRDAVSGFWIFEVPEDTPKITPEDVQRALDAEDLEYAKYFRKP
jgi:hypothetical protein